jgi:hypothetical protein
VEAGGKLLLRQAQCAADDFQARGLLHTGQPFRRQRLRVRVCQRRFMDLRIGQRVRTAPLMFGFHDDISAAQPAEERGNKPQMNTDARR